MLTLAKTIAIVGGSILIAAGIDFFLMPVHVLDGGFIGLALIANYIFGAKVGLLLLLLSIPVFGFAWSEDKGLMIHSLYGLLFTTYFIDMLEPLSYHVREPLKISPFASAALGGLLIGIGFGLLLRYEASTGGMDLLARLLTKRVRINVGILILIMDALVVSLGGLLFSADTFFLSVTAICVGDLATGLITMQGGNDHRGISDYRFIGRF